MPFHSEYRGYEIHIEEARRSGDHQSAGIAAWKVVRGRLERATGLASSREEAYLAACDAIDTLEADPYRFPINLIGYPDALEGDVITRDGEVIGRWRSSGDGALEFVDFLPDGADDVLFSEHFVGLLCQRIREWHQAQEAQ